MEKVLELIEKKKQEFAKSGLFEFMRDQSIDPRQRLAFAPCIAPFAMSLGEFNKYVFREEPTNDPLQVIVTITLMKTIITGCGFWKIWKHWVLTKRSSSVRL